MGSKELEIDQIASDLVVKYFSDRTVTQKVWDTTQNCAGRKASEVAFDPYRSSKPHSVAAVQQDGRALEFASEELKKDPTVVLAAVQQDGCALEFASEELKKDPTVVLAA